MFSEDGMTMISWSINEYDIKWELHPTHAKIHAMQIKLNEPHIQPESNRMGEALMGWATYLTSTKYP
jgi:hypothetical protein